MQRLYLIRHARPDIPQGKRLCLGTTDLPLGTLGRLQAVQLAHFLADRPIARVYASDLCRAVETARAISPEVTVVPALREVHTGLWDGLDFQQIREIWPDIYEKRGTDPGFPIPGAEPLAQARSRFCAGVMGILEEAPRGEMAIVAHATVIGTFLSHVLGTDVELSRSYRLDHTGITTLDWDGSAFHIRSINRLPRPPLTQALCLQLLTAANAPLEHCRAVADTAKTMALALAEAGVTLDIPRIIHGALLHDLARREPDHPQAGAQWLEALGYPEEADIVRCHHDPDTEALCEKTLVFLADKLPLEQRFAGSLEKCKTPEAREAHRRRCRQALALKHTVNALCGKEILL